MKIFRLWAICGLLLPGVVFASGGANPASPNILLGLAVVIGGGALSWSVRKINLPSVVGELSLGMLLAIFAHYHVGGWTEILNNPSLALLAQIGSILLLFEIGLESNLGDLLAVGKHGITTAIIGMVVPFVVGAWLVAEWAFASSDIKLNLFLGATLAATSTGISVRVFKDLGILASPACQVVLAASIIDDILGLILLAFVSGLAVAGVMSWLTIGHILFNVGLFFLLSLVLARRLMPSLFAYLQRKISHEESFVVAIIIASSFLWAWFAEVIGLAAIIGGFVAGLILDRVVYHQAPNLRDGLSSTSLAESPSMPHMVELIRPLNYVLVPVFFVYAGSQIDVIAVASWHTLWTGLALSAAAVGGKVVSGIALPKRINRWIVGFGMVPRGEIGLIFALSGRQLGVFNNEVFAAVMFMVVVTSLLTPIMLQLIVKSSQR